MLTRYFIVEAREATECPVAPNMADLGRSRFLRPDREEIRYIEA
jgi:hypothetical protein